MPDALEAGLLLLAAGLPLSIAAVNLSLAALTAVLLWKLHTKEAAWQRSWNGAFATVLLYCAAALLVCLASVNPGRSLHDAVKDWHKPWALAVLLLALQARPKARLTEALAAGFGAAALVGLWQAATQRAGTAWMRAHAFVHPVAYGEMLGCALLGAVCFRGRAETGLTSASAKRAAEAFFLLVFAALVLSQTRGAVAGAAAGFAAICAVDRRLRRWALPALAALIAAGAVWQLMPGNGRSLSTLLRFQLRLPDGRYNPALVRVELWDVAWRIFKDHPWFGAGPGNYDTVFSQYFQGSLDNQTVWGSAHNLFFQQLAERGLVGLAALLGVLATLTARAYSRARTNPNAWSLWAWGAWVAFLVMNLTEDAFQHELVTVVFLFVWAWAEANRDIPAGHKL